MSEGKKSFEVVTFLLCVTVVITTAIGSSMYYNINDRKLMASNIDNAIAQGVDPFSVRCSYAQSTDAVCVAYAASHNSQAFHVPETTKK